MKINGHNGDDGPSWPFEPRPIDMPSGDKPEKSGGGICLLLVIAMLGIPVVAAFDIAEAIRLVTS